MNIKRYLLASIAVAVFIGVWGWLFHGIFLAHIYGTIAYTWGRPVAEAQTMVGWLVVGYILFGLSFAYFFTWKNKSGGAKQGLTYGFWVGMMFAATMCFWYVSVPISFSLAVWWFVGGLVELTIAGLLVGLIYQHK